MEVQGKQYISASRVAGVLGRSPWDTPLTLYKHYKDGSREDESGAMASGKALEPLVLKEAAFMMGAELTEGARSARAAASEMDAKKNTLIPQKQWQKAYETHKTLRLGCLPDAVLWTPHGNVLVEAKCCFNEAVWRDQWFKGEAIPTHYQVQLAAMMMVLGMDEARLAVWFGGEVQNIITYTLDEENERTIANGVTDFAKMLDDGTPPAAHGAPKEWNMLRQIPVNDKIIELEEGKDDEKIRLIKQWYAETKSDEVAQAKEIVKGGKNVTDTLKTNILAELADKEMAVLPKGVKLPDGRILFVKQSYIPQATIQRKASTRTAINLWTPKDEGASK